jgi:ribosome-binding factor A
MSRRTQRIANLVRNSLGALLLSKLSDPRVDPARTSITRVEVPEDLLTAKVFVSVMGTPAEQRKTVTALKHAAGRLQDLLARDVQLRHTPVLRFELDTQFKKTLQTLEIINQAMEEIHARQRARDEADGPESQPSDDQDVNSDSQDSDE